MQMTERAVELLGLPSDGLPRFLLDIGYIRVTILGSEFIRIAPFRCGSGLSGEQLTEQGHYWVGIDISEHMLGVLLNDVMKSWHDAIRSCN